VYDLSDSIFVAYNDLLDANSPLCVTPDLNGGNAQCIKVFPPDINGTFELTETPSGSGDWDVHVEQNLNSVINASISAFNADVVITALSLTVLDGTGTGTIPGTIVLDTFTDAVGTQNMVVDTAFPGAGGTAQCLAVNTTDQGTACTCTDKLAPCADCINWENLGQTCGNLVANQCDPVEVSGPLTNPTAICNIAGLPITFCEDQWPGNGLLLQNSGCFYDLPTPDDNLARLFSDIVTTGTTIQLGGGNTAADGYYRANLYDPGSGPQFIALTGVQQ
jgi:hypothetical protein